MILLILFNMIVTPHFLSAQTLSTNLYQVAETVILAMGMTLVIATGGIDLSVGSVMSIAGSVAALIFVGRIFSLSGPISYIVAIVVAVLVAALCGLFNGFLVTVFRIQPIVATLILYIAGRGIAEVLVNGVVDFSNPTFQFIGSGTILGAPFQVIVMLIIALFFIWLVRGTVFGQQVVATGGNEPAARLAGIPVARVKLTVYIIIGVLAGIAGIFYISNNSSADPGGIGLGMELNAIVAVGGSSLLGGQANIPGTFVGVIFIQLLTFSLTANNISADISRVVEALLIILAVYLQTQRNAA
ncbi:ABC transporter permease [Dictyobacter arantiisoli]|uniref:Monosaccharide-transporting ATPase n=1 Tax=Dictyobacter arantiisoli TaxID=2014874 RepID=A0A5A5T823_9CHLR|nr:ABC transporter permease [Dictyobacter arantiisoli]GCF07119.1 monosaccharide-transporting ATPase [Dictyobacter arantiisoli]